MLNRRRKSEVPERVNPGDREPERCVPGSIEQQLDMCEEGELRGEEVLRRTDERDVPGETSGDPMAADLEMDTFNTDMAEADREGDEMSGDEHSYGQQGSDPTEEPLPMDSPHDIGEDVTDKRQDPRERRSFTRRKIA